MFSNTTIFFVLIIKQPITYRLTRFCDEGGVGRAWTFAQLDGVKHILQLKKRHGFQGFESLATLLIRRVFEDKKTVKYAMNKV